MNLKSVPTRGRTLDYAAGIYDIFEPMCMLGKEAEINKLIINLLEIKKFHNILDLGCGTGVLSALISEELSEKTGGLSVGIDAAAKMIEAARKKRGSKTCRFEVAAAENLPFDNESFESVVSTMFFHHIQLDLKEKALLEAFRVMRPGGRLVIADMHVPTTFLGALISHLSRWILFQPQIGENIRGVLPGLIEKAKFTAPELVKTYFGYIAVFSSRKPQ
jgi:ubiquinone/menaquinone biosynthesis C-methylase UbiE